MNILASSSSSSSSCSSYSLIFSLSAWIHLVSKVPGLSGPFWKGLLALQVLAESFKTAFLKRALRTSDNLCFSVVLPSSEEQERRQLSNLEDRTSTKSSAPGRRAGLENRRTWSNSTEKTWRRIPSTTNPRR